MIAIVAVSIGLYVSQYDNLKLDVDTVQSSHSFPTEDAIELRLVIVLTIRARRLEAVPWTKRR